MAQVSILGSDGKAILYASLNGEDLQFQFEYYSRGPEEGDYEFIHTVKAEDFSAIARKFELDLDKEILTLVQEISDCGRGEELKEALTNKEIKNELWTWYT
jgi:hypothetical protein